MAVLSAALQPLMVHSAHSDDTIVACTDSSFALATLHEGPATSCPCLAGRVVPLLDGAARPLAGAGEDRALAVEIYIHVADLTMV